MGGQSLALQGIDLVMDYNTSASGNPAATQPAAWQMGQPLALNHANFQLGEGERVAIMGPSGSGKSTLLKLLCGQYAPSTGRIENGFRARSAVFQNYVRYKMPLEQNVRISDLDRGGNVNGALALAGVAVDRERFPDGLATMLSGSVAAAGSPPMRRTSASWR